MGNPCRTSDAVRILHRRYVGGDVQRKASLEQERVNAEVARTIYELREQAGLSQKELADRVETTQSVITGTGGWRIRPDGFCPDVCAPRVASVAVMLTTNSYMSGQTVSVIGGW